MKTFAVALDLLREASHRRWFLALGIAVTLLLVVLLASLKLDVVDGALAGTRLFGSFFPQRIQAADVALRPVFEMGSYAIFYGGMAFGIFACADFAPSLLSPGRIEHLLALPLRRWELLLGTFLGVVTLAMGAALYGAGGLTLILGLKSGVWTARPLLAAALSTLGFATIYSGMVAAAVFARSAALSASVGAVLFVSGMLASFRGHILPLFQPGLGRSLFALYTLFMPRLASLADVSAKLAASARPDWAGIGELVLGLLVFAMGALALGLWRFEQRDF